MWVLILFFIVLMVLSFYIILKSFSIERYFDLKYKYYSCSMENGTIVTCFIIRAKSDTDAVTKVKNQVKYGWYYDILCPFKEITIDRAKELVSVGARVI